MLRYVALVRTDFSEELSTAFIRVTRIGELGTTLAVTSNRLTLRRNTKWAKDLLDSFVVENISTVLKSKKVLTWIQIIHQYVWN
jgi:hypothetical protein